MQIVEGARRVQGRWNMFTQNMMKDEVVPRVEAVVRVHRINCMMHPLHDLECPPFFREIEWDGMS